MIRSAVLALISINYLMGFILFYTTGKPRINTVVIAGLLQLLYWERQVGKTTRKALIKAVAKIVDKSLQDRIRLALEELERNNQN